MTDPTARNRLEAEASPYLRQHADNPVHWQPWDDEALAAAEERDVPIFLSIGYSACHWCHVMEAESFADEAIAEILNEEFVPIKVDREERPDLDSVYMTICQLVTGGGGWPLSVWLTPDGEPFYVGTYFPPRSRGRTPSFRDVLSHIVESWNDPEDRAEMEARAEQWTGALTSELEETPSQPGRRPESDSLDDAVRAAIRSADREHGGFGASGPKFPQSRRLELLLRAAAASGSDEALAVVREGLDAMIGGGLYDHVGGGFHRYAVDREWTVPHFEKMLYDNAELTRLLIAAHQYTGEERYADFAAETLEFVDRELSHPDGGFYSTLDAQSGGEEGTFYVWTPEQVHDALDEPTATLFCERYGVTSGGNFENGTTVLTISTSLERLAEERGRDVAAVEADLDDARETLFEAREARERPPRDEKILAGWNGLMISAYAAAGRALDEAYADRGAAALSFVREHLWDRDRLRRRYIETDGRGDVAGDGYLEDYAFLARGAFDLYQVTGDVDHLAFAVDLARVIETEFWDADRGTLYFTPAAGESLVARPQELTDRSTPSSLGVAVGVLLDLDHFVPEADFEEIAARVLETHGDRIRGGPLEHVSLVLAADRYATGGRELTVAAESMPGDWRERLARAYLPNTVVAPRPPTADELDAWLDALGVSTAPPIWADRDARDERPTVYACESFTCSEPGHDLTAALEWFGESSA
ncbi:thioredoxin domain-containing protein [Haloferacaceae archaeon DSL9]